MLGIASSTRDLAADVGEVRRELAADRAAADDRGARRAPGPARARGRTTGSARRRSRSPGVDAASEPVARISASPVSSVPSETRTWCAAASTIVPVPGTTVTLRPLSSDSRPLVSRSTTCCLRAWLVGEVERRLAGVDAELLGAADGAQHLGGLQQLLGRDAAPVQAGPADPRLLDHRDVAARPRRRTARPRSHPARRRGRRRRSAQPRVTSGSVGRADGHCLAPRHSDAAPTGRRSSGEEDLDRTGREDRQAGDQRQDHQRPRLHAAIFAAGRSARRSHEVAGPRRPRIRATTRPLCCAPPGTLGAAFGGSVHRSIPRRRRSGVRTREGPRRKLIGQGAGRRARGDLRGRRRA